MIRRIIGRKLERAPIENKAGPAVALGHASGNCAKVRVRRKVIFQIAETEHHVRKLPVAIGNPLRRHGRAVSDPLKRQAIGIGQWISFNGPAVG